MVLLCVLLGDESTVQTLIAVGTNLGAFGAIGALVFLGYQSMKLRESIQLQTEDFHLEKRPYLYVHFEPQFHYAGKDIYGGGHIVYRNEGRIPSSNVSSAPEAYSNERGKIPIKEWHIEYFGGYAEVKTVFPNHVDAKIFFKGDMGSEATFFAIGALVAYTGIQRDKTYWFKFSQVYNIVGDGKRVVPHLISHDTDWDQNTKPVPLPPQEPDWSKYKDYLGKKARKANLLR